ncbi:hypothetical protein NRC85_003797 [Vibrio parahaemolyticus]|nr:hypothetical protein [Vibrio parahaemolyticus]
MEQEKYQSLLLDLHKAYPFLENGMIPLAIGCGGQMREALQQAGHNKEDASTFVDHYFFSTEYRVALINAIDDPERRRFNLDGSISESVVTDRDLYALAFVRNVYMSESISPKARTYSRKEQGKLRAKKEKLKYHVNKLCQLGFSKEFILSKIGKKAAPYIVDCDWSGFKEEDLNSARMLSNQANRFAKREIRAFQKQMLNKGVPVALINLASGDKQDFIYATIYESANKEHGRKSNKPRRTNRTSKRRNQSAVKSSETV